MQLEVENQKDKKEAALSKLENTEQMRALDPGNMYNYIFDFPEQLARALNIGKSWKIDKDMFQDIKNVVVTGMGGSAIGGDLARSFLSSKLLIPFHVCRNYILPEFVDDESLVITSSYSGNTEEPLAALDDALSRKAMTAAISTGGMLADVCKLNEIPLATLPGGMQPRSALGFSFIPLLMLLQKVGLIEKTEEQVKTAIDGLKKFREDYTEDVQLSANPAKKLAERLQGKVIIIYSGPTLTDAVAVRWKGQFCENSKTLAFANQFPEFNHNELVGWSDVTRDFADKIAVIILRDSEDHSRIKKRMDIVNPLIEEAGADVIEVESRGSTELERILSLIQMGDFVSYYLAILNDQDPTPVLSIEMLKDALSDKDV